MSIILPVDPSTDSIGFFRFGRPFNEIVSIIQKRAKEFGSVQIRYDKSQTFASDLVLDLVTYGMVLRFHGETQLLNKVVVYEPAKCSLSFMSSEFCGKTAPTYQSVYKTFQIAYPGDYDDQRGQYYLHYPGIIFTFNIEEKYRDVYKKQPEGIGLRLPNNPEVSRIVFYSKFVDPSTNNTSFPYAPPDYFETVEAHPGLGVRFQKRGAWVKFGNSVQTLLVVLGTPDQVTTKHENKKIVAYSSTGGEGGAGRGGKFRPNDYFYNYFSLGVDILIDGEKHDVKKFVLHTNIPSHPLFSKYDRCNFQVQVQGGNPMGGLDTLITFKSNWKDVTRLLGEPIGKPVVLDLSADHTQNPFGPSSFCGYQNIIFEITNGYKIASVCLFKE